ncbi:MAG: TetR/AcrR family transcriptional regulator [Alphaproteobacteria bacterium]|jgi:TetR/AcrR family transcriptional regulator
MVGVRAKTYDDKRQLILERATELFARHGFRGTSVSEIAEACGASKALIYHYFGSKEEMLYELLTGFIEMYHVRLERAVKKAEKPTDRLRAYLRESIAVLSKYRMNYARLFSELDALPAKQREEVRSAERSILELLRSTLVAINPALADNTKVTPVTLLALGTMVWSYTWYDPARALSLDELVELTTRFVIGGLDGVTGDGK